ncbi:MAG: glycosyltransferase [Candidatus Korarchaeota archaeon]|nr:glycosyltransferase [Candidatus Korarchaeota archaeon]
MGRGGRFPLSYSIVIPAYNEESGIESCVRSALSQSIEPEEIVVINDGSTDSTPDILRKYEGLIKIIRIDKNTGNKALALREAIPHLRGDVIVYTDADSVLHPRAAEKMLVHFLDPKVGGVSGLVRSRKHNIITGIRELQYIYGQYILKRGMAAINAVPVIPGCVGAVRRELFDPSPETVTEDTDMTLTILSRGYEVVYEMDSIAWTSDPPNFRSYIRQGIRWYSGYFQNLRKHFRSLPARVKFQVAISTIDNTLFSVLLIAALLFQFFLRNQTLIYLFLMETIVWLISAAYGAFTMGRRDLFKSLIVSPIFRTLDSLLWIYASLRELVIGKRDLRWHRSDRFTLNDVENGLLRRETGSSRPKKKTHRYGLRDEGRDEGFPSKEGNGDLSMP